MKSNTKDTHCDMSGWFRKVRERNRATIKYEKNNRML